MMTKIPKKPTGMPEDFYQKCIAVTKKRAQAVIWHILKNGTISTEELSDIYGYDHPPRAIRDVREAGIPLETFSTQSARTGRKIAAYRFADPAKAIAGRIGGRKSFSKKFKDALIARYGARSHLTGELLEPRYLQIDHRIPYEIAGNSAEENVENYMLLDASAQRAKSWSCENCENYREIKDKERCRSCFWASPEAYDHIALCPERRLDIIWREDELEIYNHIISHSKNHNISPQVYIKNLLTAHLSKGK